MRVTDELWSTDVPGRARLISCGANLGDFKVDGFGPLKVTKCTTSCALLGSSQFAEMPSLFKPTAINFPRYFA